MESALLKGLQFRVLKSVQQLNMAKVNGRILFKAEI